MFEIDELKAALDVIANQAINFTEPETKEQAIENLKGLKSMIDSTLNFHK